MKYHQRLAGALLLALLASGPSQAAGARATYTRNVAIVLYEGVEILDFAGPTEVLQSASDFGSVDGANAFRVFTVALTKEPLKSQGVVTITPEFSFADAPRADIVVIPGGSSQRLTGSEEAMAWIRKAVNEAELTLTVCTGAFALAKTGITQGKDITTWYGALEGLRKAAPLSTVQPGRRFIDNGRFITTAGVSAGIDGSLHLVARLLGRAVADRTAQYMEYRWTPEAYLAQRYQLLNPGTDERGRALQLSQIHLDEGRGADAARICRELLAKDPHDAGAWYRLGTIAFSESGYAEAAAAFHRAAENPELRSRALYNRACALARGGRKGDALSALREAVASGFGPRVAVEGDTDLESLHGDPQFQAILASMDRKS
jgi:transcriptional regulator GlxA family with amidase domain